MSRSLGLREDPGGEILGYANCEVVFRVAVNQKGVGSSARNRGGLISINPSLSLRLHYYLDAQYSLRSCLYSLLLRRRCSAVFLTFLASIWA